MAKDNERFDNRELDGLFVEYRAACAEPEGGPNFVPGIWQRIEARRNVTTFLFRRWAEVCVVATAAAALLISTFLIPRYERAPVYQAHYIDVLADADTTNDAVVLPVGDFQ